MANNSSQNTNLIKQPFGCWVLSLLVIVTSVQTIRSVQFWQTSEAVARTLPFPLWLLTTYETLWALLWVVCLLAMLTRRLFASRLTLFVVITYGIMRGLQMALLYNADYDRQRLPFALLMIAIVLGIVLIGNWRYLTMRNQEGNTLDGPATQDQ